MPSFTCFKLALKKQTNKIKITPYKQNVACKVFKRKWEQLGQRATAAYDISMITFITLK